LLNNIYFSGITWLFNESPEARKPDIKWRLYVFKTGEMLNGKSLWFLLKHHIFVFLYYNQPPFF